MKRRPRRLRRNEAIRSLVKETTLHVKDLIYPLFIVEGMGIKREISSLPDTYHMSVDQLSTEILELKELGINHVLLFGVLEDKYKNREATMAYHDNGIIQRAIKEIKATDNSMNVITDVCMCEYTEHGHCGLIKANGEVDNDATLPYLCKIALSHAKAGADIIAPSDMMDGRIKAIRQILDKENFEDIPIMSYSVKYASNYYGPFREAAKSKPVFGNRKTYQMDYANRREALTEVFLDTEEGADFLIVKPALAYLDVIYAIKESSNLPIVAYNVSGEYAMLKMAVSHNILDENVIYESILSIKRAGADVIITYFAKDLAKILRRS